MTGRGFLQVGCMLLGSSALVAQQPGTFKAGARTVAVYATVLDESGRLVPDLERDAFQIRDNGTQQALTVFGNYTQPITVVMMLDRSGSMQAEFGLVEQAAEAFVEQLGPDDKARIGSFSNRIQVDPREFSSDHDKLLEILRGELQEAGPTPLWNAVNVAITALAHQEGRRVVLVFTDGVDRPMNFSANNSSLREVMKRAEREDVMVYAIGLAGHNAPSGRPARAPMGGGHHGGFGRGGGFGGGGGFGRGGGGAGGGRHSSTPEKPDDGLPKIAAESGGGYFELTSADDLAATFRRVAEELHHQYLLGFTPASLDGKVHRLDATVVASSRTVRARKSYLASAE
jgi:Ca-activated chloride channel family protein